MSESRSDKVNRWVRKLGIKQGGLFKYVRTSSGTSLPVASALFFALVKIVSGLAVTYIIAIFNLGNFQRISLHVCRVEI